MSSAKQYEPERFRSSEYQAVWSDTPASSPCRVAPQAIEVMKSVAVKAYPYEACGLLLGRLDVQGWQVLEAREVENLNKERAADRFQLDPQAYQRIDKDIRGTGLEIIGVFHSHPDCPAKPSPTDLDSAWEGFVYPIVSVCEGQVVDIRFWEPQERTRCFHPVEVVEVCE